MKQCIKNNYLSASILVLSILFLACNKTLDMGNRLSNSVEAQSDVSFLRIDATVYPGIIPDDANDDSRAMQALFNSAAFGTVIFFPAGKYLIDTPVTILAKGITIKGQTNTVFQFGNATTDWYNAWYYNVGMINIGADSITIDSITLDQNFRESGRNGSGGAAPEAPVIAGIIIGSYPDTGSSHSKISKRLKAIAITNTRVIDYYGDAITVFNASVTDYTVSGNTLISAYVYEGWDTLNHLPLGHGGQSISIAGGSNITITHNVIYGALDDAIATHASAVNVSITNNTITTTGGRILLIGIQTGTVSYNTIKYLNNQHGDGIWITFAASGGHPVMNDSLIVSNNKITINGFSGNHGIRLYGPGTKIHVFKNILKTAIDNKADGFEITNQIANSLSLNYFGNEIYVNGNRILNYGTRINYHLTSSIYPLTPATAFLVDTTGNILKP